MLEEAKINKEVMSYHGGSHEEVPGQQCPQAQDEED